MMEDLDRALNRQDQRLDQRIFADVVVNSVSDIKRLMGELDPTRNQVAETVKLATSVDIKEDDKTARYALSANTQSKSKRDMLIDGLTIIKNRENMQTDIVPIEINGRSMIPAKVGGGTEAHSWVDPLIKRWFGAKREGVIIYWDLADGFRYKYDVFEHKLTRVPLAKEN
jgi:hypothetical protein